MDRTTWFDTIPSSMAGAEVISNALDHALSVAAIFGRRDSTTTGLQFGWYGGRIYVDGVAVDVGGGSHVGTTALTASATNYVEVDRAGAVSKNTTAFSADKCPLWVITTGGSSQSEWIDHRDPYQLAAFFGGRGHGVATQAMADANQTLAFAKAICHSIEFTGALTALRDAIVPTMKRQWTVYANVTGGFGVRVKTSGGSGITVADGKRAILECDGTNVVRITPDT